MKFFGERMIKYLDYEKYNPETDIDKPVFFEGLYFKEDYEVLKKHRGKKTIYWNGSDANRLLKEPEFAEIMKNIQAEHLCQSVYSVDKLARMGIEATHFPAHTYPFSGTTFHFQL